MPTKTNARSGSQVIMGSYQINTGQGFDPGWSGEENKIHHWRSFSSDKLRNLKTFQFMQAEGGTKDRILAYIESDESVPSQYIASFADDITEPKSYARHLENYVCSGPKYIKLGRKPFGLVKEHIQYYKMGFGYDTDNGSYDAHMGILYWHDNHMDRIDGDYTDYRSTLGINREYNKHRGIEMRSIDCHTDATWHNCMYHGMAFWESANEFYFGGVYTHSSTDPTLDGKIYMVITRLDETHNSQWTAGIDTGYTVDQANNIGQTTRADNYHHISLLAFMSITLTVDDGAGNWVSQDINRLFAAANSDGLDSVLFMRFNANDGAALDDFKKVELSKSGYSFEVLEIYAHETTFDLLFACIKTVSKSSGLNGVKVVQIDFANDKVSWSDTDSGGVDIPNPFEADTSHTIESATYRPGDGSNQAFQFIIGGSTKRVSKDGQDETFDYNHGFIYGLDDVMFDNCFSKGVEGALSGEIPFGDAQLGTLTTLGSFQGDIGINLVEPGASDGSHTCLHWDGTSPDACDGGCVWDNEDLEPNTLDRQWCTYGSKFGSVFSQANTADSTPLAVLPDDVNGQNVYCEQCKEITISVGDLDRIDYNIYDAEFDPLAFEKFEEWSTTSATVTMTYPRPDQDNMHTRISDFDQMANQCGPLQIDYYVKDDNDVTFQATEPGGYVLISDTVSTFEDSRGTQFAQVLNGNSFEFQVSNTNFNFIPDNPSLVNNDFNINYDYHLWASFIEFQTEIPPVEKSNVLRIKDPCLRFNLNLQGPFIPSTIYYELSEGPIVHQFRANQADFSYNYYDNGIQGWVKHTIIIKEACGPLTYELINTETQKEEEDLIVYEPSADLSTITIEAYSIDTVLTPLVKERYTQSSLFYAIRIMPKYFDVHPPFEIPFEVRWNPCSVGEVQHSQMNDVNHEIASGSREYSVFPIFEQLPYDCLYAPVITSYWAEDETRLPPGIVGYEYDAAKDLLIYEIDPQLKEEKGYYQVVIEVYYPEDPDYFTDNSWTWTLQNTFKGYPSTNEIPPTYDATIFPGVIRMNVGERIEVTTGPGSEDSAALMVDVMAKGDWSKFIQYEINENTWAIDFIIDAYSEEWLGQHEIRIELVDNSADSKDGKPEDERSLFLDTDYVITIIISQKTIEEQMMEEEFIEEIEINDGCTKNCNPIMSLDGMNTMGLLTISFDRDMVIPSTQWSGVNNYMVGKGLQDQPNDFNDIQISVFPGESQEDEAVALKWIVKSFSKESMEIQVIFEKAIYISTGFSKDTLEIKINDIFALVDSKLGRPVLKTTFKLPLGPQMPLSQEGQDLIDGAKDVKDGMKGGVFANLALNLVLQNSIQSILGMINSLQILLHLPAMGFNIPGNAATLFSSVIHIVNVNVIPEEVIAYCYFWLYGTDDSPVGSEEVGRNLQEVVEEEEQEDEAIVEYESSNLAALGYGGVIFIENLETLYPLIIVYILMWIMVGLAKIAKYCCHNHAQSVIDYLLTKLMWNSVVLFVIEGYVELSISVFLDWKYFKYDSFDRHQLISHSVSLLFGAVLILFPLYIYWFFSKLTEGQLRSEQMTQRYGSLYDGLKIKRLQGVNYFAIFAIRRAILTSILVFGSGMPWLQLQAGMFSSLGMIIYLCQVKPFDVRFQNNLEVLNEYLNLIMLYHLVCVSDFQPDIEVRFNVIGRSFMYSTGLNLFINTMIVLITQYRLLRAGWLKQTRLQRYNAQKARFQEIAENAKNESFVRPGLQLEEARRTIQKEAIQEAKRDVMNQEELKEQFGIYDYPEDKLSGEALDKQATEVAAKTKYMFEYYGWRKVGAMPIRSGFADLVNKQQGLQIKHPIVTVERSRLKVLDPENSLIGLTIEEKAMLMPGTPNFNHNLNTSKYMKANESKDGEDTV